MLTAILNIGTLPKCLTKCLACRTSCRYKEKISFYYIRCPFITIFLCYLTLFAYPIASQQLYILKRYYVILYIISIVKLFRLTGISLWCQLWWLFLLFVQLIWVIIKCLIEQYNLYSRKMTSHILDAEYVLPCIMILKYHNTSNTHFWN